MGRFWVKDRVEERSFVSLYYETPSITDNMALSPITVFVPKKLKLSVRMWTGPQC